MGDSQTSVSGTSPHRHSNSSADGGALRTNTTSVQVAETSAYHSLQTYTTIQGVVFG